MEKVAIINTIFGYDSTGMLAKNLYEYGKENGYEVFAFYGRGQKETSDHIVRIDSVIDVAIHKVMTLLTGYQGRFSSRATRRMIKTIELNNINKIILLNLHGYYLNEPLLFRYLKQNHRETIYITADEYAGLGKCCYSNNCTKYIDKCEKCPQKHVYPQSLFFDRASKLFEQKKEEYKDNESLIFLGPETNLQVFRRSALTKNKRMKSISWGIDLQTYKYGIDENVYKKYNIPRDKIIILTVAPFSSERKGVQKYFFPIAKRLEGTKYHFINVGYDGNQKNEDIPNNMTTIRYIKDQKELAKIYSISDLYVLASTTDTMPISCLISFACCTPVCCFYTSGLVNLAEKNNLAVRYCTEINIDALEKTIRNSRKKDQSTMDACRNLANAKYSQDAFNRAVYESFERE